MWPSICSEQKVYDIPSILLKNRIILLTEEINPLTSTSIIGQLLYLESDAPGEDIHLYINSPGGSISDGFAIYDCMNRISSKVNTYATGMTASMAAFLLSSGTGKRYAYPNSTIMIHQPLGGVQGQAADIQIVAKRILTLREKLYTIFSENTNGKAGFEEIAQACDRDNYMTPEEALEMGLIDEIL